MVKSGHFVKEDPKRSQISHTKVWENDILVSLLSQVKYVERTSLPVEGSLASLPKISHNNMLGQVLSPEEKSSPCCGLGGSP
jgi:hypothetical protein